MINDKDLAVELENVFREINSWLKNVLKKYFQNNCVELTLSQYRVLNFLPESGKIKMSELSECLSTSSGSLTVMIDRLIEKGLVERSFSAEDRRVVLVNINESGKKAINEFRKGFLEIMSEDLKALGKAEKELIYGSMKKLKYLLMQIEK